MKIGRNQPCPCGSGKKYKKCCLDKGGSFLQPQPQVQAPFAGIGEEFAGQQFGNIEEAQVAVDQVVEEKNKAARDEFCGLSSEQVNAILYSPLDSPEVVSFSKEIEPPADAPVLRLFLLLADAIGDKGLKATAKGNLPRKFCQDSALSLWGEQGYAERTASSAIRMETDFEELHCMRVAAQQAGLIQLEGGKFILTVKCREVVDSEGNAGLYWVLFKGYVTDFNWAYRDQHTEIHMIQRAYLFSLYLLSCYGGKAESEQFYAEKFLTAFPLAIEEVPEPDEALARETLKKSYVLRTFEHFAAFFALASICTSDEAGATIQKTPALDQFVSFSV